MVIAAVLGVVVSLAAWAFLELIHQIQQGVFDDLPKTLGYDDGAPVWWPLPVLGLAGLVIAYAIVRLPGAGGHNPAEGLKTGVTQPVALPGVMLAALATIGLGLVLGPEAPLIALGSALGLLAVRLVRKDAPESMRALVAAAGSFAAISFIFGSPLIGAVILIEAAGLDRRRL
jgi:chloride channel protein, CIC family